MYNAAWCVIFMLLPLVIHAVVADEQLNKEENREEFLQFRQFASVATLQYTGGHWPGMKNPFGSACLFTYLIQEGNPFVSFLDLRVHKYTNGGMGANIGMGFRKPIDIAEIFWGANLYLDTQQYKSHNFYQCGLGLELFSSFADLSINFYSLIGKSQYLSKQCTCRWENYWFKQNIYATALSGGNLEVRSSPLELLSTKQYLGVGCYWFSRGHLNLRGLSAGIESQLNRFCSVEIKYAYDVDTHSNWQYTFSLEFPLGDNSQIGDLGSVYRPPRRNSWISKGNSVDCEYNY